MTNTEASAATQTAAVAEQGAQVAPEKASSKKGATQKKAAPKGQKTAKGGKAKAAKPGKEAKAPSKKAAKKESLPREFSKKAIILDLLRRKQGATLAEIMKVSEWQAHSVRGFISGTLMKKMDLPVESFKNEAGDRTYRIAK